MALTKGQPMAVQICSRQIYHSLAAYLQLQVVWVYIIFAPKGVTAKECVVRIGVFAILTIMCKSKLSLLTSTNFYTRIYQYNIGITLTAFLTVFNEIKQITI
ncbi:hypothetical protein FHO46_12585 [Vibrio cholerae]|nr:hypothetical protein [Vibrio cholerae]EGR0935889.1 hypothetical protein [Vibrio cholerae]TXY89350.1 hypothetical protein FXE72_12210 [Vibrio cholerae]